jgi:hypothetical protein
MEVGIDTANKTAKLTAFKNVGNDPRKMDKRETVIRW